MSHYNCAVFSYSLDDLDNLLAPYCELVELGSPYAVFRERKEADIDPVTGKRGYWYNPEARWDWWEIGGRWSGFLRLKEQCRGHYDHLSREDRLEQIKKGVCDQALASYCKFGRDEEIYQSRLEEWDRTFEEARQPDRPEAVWLELKSQYLLRQYGSREHFAEEEAQKHPYAFVTAEGEWHEAGRMGYFGMDDETPESRAAFNDEYDSYLEYAVEENLYITIVDMHI